MIIVEVIGGLGNQMFQYAAGRALSVKLNKSLKVDASGFENYHLHNGFELQRIFSEGIELSSKEDLDLVLGFRANKIIKKVMTGGRAVNFRGSKLIVEPYSNYWKGIETISGNSYLCGYWQSEKYFKSIESVIRNDFKFKLPLSGKNTEIASEIADNISISVHIRRGDYVLNKKNLQIHGVCSLSYYKKAMEYFSDVFKKPIFFVFSDDISWAMENFPKSNSFRFINHNKGVENYNDMRLMSMCKHHIIANSSFSWWGAWLNAESEKIVFAPKSWYASNLNSVVDLLPDSWIKI